MIHYNMCAAFPVPAGIMCIREFQIDNDSKESVHTGLETLTHLIRNRKLLLSAHESH